MIIRKFMLVAVLTLASSTAFAQLSTHKTPENKVAPGREGTAEDQTACRPDVRRYCHNLDPDAGSLSFLACLQEHRDKLRRACLDVLERNGQ